MKTYNDVSDAEERVRQLDSGEEDQTKPSGGGCYITTACMTVMGAAFADDHIELETLREHRDRLAVERAGIATLVREYYRDAPAIVEAIDARPDQVAIYGAIYTAVVRPTNELLAAGNDEEAITLYYQAFCDLRDEFLEEQGRRPNHRPALLHHTTGGRHKPSADLPGKYA